MEVHGRRWAQVAAAVPTRTDIQCRERFTNQLDPALQRGPWAPNEDAALEAAVTAELKPNGGVRWAAVSRALPGRTDAMCKRRWGTLQASIKVLFMAGAPGMRCSQIYSNSVYKEVSAWLDNVPT